MTTGQNDYALIIGINRYPCLVGGKPKHLQGAERDAISFKGWLLSPDGGGVPEANTRTILSSDFKDTDEKPPYELEPSFEMIKKAMRQIHLEARASRDKGATPRRLYVFVSGHGFSPGYDDVGLFTSRANLPTEGTEYLQASGWMNWFYGEGLFTEHVLLADCCRRPNPHVVEQTCGFSRTGGTPRGARLYGFAAAYGKEAAQIERGSAVQGAFTSVVLEGLRGAAADAHGVVTSTRLMDYIELELPDLVRDQAAGNGLIGRTPDFRQRDGFELCRVKRPDFELRIVSQCATLGKVSWTNNRGVGGSVPLVGGAASLRLTRGIYKIEWVANGQRRSHIVELKRSSTLVVGSEVATMSSIDVPSIGRATDQAHHG